MVTYDERKRRANILKHGIDFSELINFFEGELLTREDTRYSYSEMRFQSIGWHQGRLILVV